LLGYLGCQEAFWSRVGPGAESGGTRSVASGFSKSAIGCPRLLCNLGPQEAGCATGRTGQKERRLRLARGGLAQSRLAGSGLACWELADKGLAG
jgi:hypothetical protein